jgi:hypothetical protein
VLEQVVRLGTLETNWWISRDMVGYELRIDPEELYFAVRLLIEEGDVESNALDLYKVRATTRGWMKFPWRGYESSLSLQGAAQRKGGFLLRPSPSRTKRFKT